MSGVPIATKPRRSSPATLLKPVKQSVPARITLVGPPSGVTFGLQRGKADLAGLVVSTGRDVHFDFVFQAQEGLMGRVRFSGEFVQGPAGSKFVYVNSGTLAEDQPSRWTRRAKVGLESLTWAAVKRVASRPGARFEARIAGTAKDGGPACASVPLLDGGWVLVPD